MSSEANDDKALTARDVAVAASAALVAQGRLRAGGEERRYAKISADAILAALDAAGFEITAKGALAEAQQRIEAVKALHAPFWLSVDGVTRCGYCNMPAPCITVRALSSSTAPETPTKPERCYHRFSNPAPGGRTVCRTCGADTTHVDAMGG